MKVYLSTDMEGTAGIVDWAQCVGDGPEAAAGRELLLAEVNAAIDGALAAGATEIVVNDSHSVMRNLAPALLHGRATYISGSHKPLYMMEGLDSSFDAIFFVSYHGSMGGDPAVLSHTYNPRAVAEVRLNGRVVGESGVNALVAAHYGVPVVLVTGDQTACEETAAVIPGVETAVVKKSITRFAAESLHPEVARELIRAAATRSIEGLAGVTAPEVPSPSALEVTWRTADMAEMATWIRGIERVSPRVTRATDDDRLRLFRTFITSVLLTRGIALER
ncbi:M55 family metallopeptidase [Actinoplanes sp. NPDC051411]|uniref:M55 family metallopeptidase n=1 Tax=Actinoplanes sp. NPDC051411 TaxID=3155522 RepID=UPI003436BF4A